MPVRLRPMNLADVGPVMALETALFPEDAWSQNVLLSELANPGCHYVVAESDGEVVGYAGLCAAVPEGDVQTMAVDERLWGRGVGSALLTALLDEARRRGVTHMFLDVREDNSRAQKLYTDFGFIRIGVRDGYYHGTDAVTMRRVDEAGGSGHKEDR